MLRRDEIKLLLRGTSGSLEKSLIRSNVRFAQIERESRSSDTVLAEDETSAACLGQSCKMSFLASQDAVVK